MELNEVIEEKNEVNEITGIIEELTEAIENIEEIAQWLSSLQVSMQILATHCGAINTLSLEEFKSLKITEEELWKYWDKVNNGKKLHILTEELAIHSSKELGYLIYDALEDTKESLQNINRLSKDIL